MTEPKCNLILDTCCELPRDLCDVPGVFMLQFSWRMGAEEMMDDLFTSMSAHEFYDAMRKGATPITAQASVVELERVFREAVDAGKPAVYLAFSSGLSGSYDVACLVLQNLKDELGAENVPITIVDTLVGSTPQGVLSLEAIRQRQRGLSAEELVAWAEEARYFVQTIFMVDNLEALRRGGRIPASVAVAGDKLDVKPLLSFDLDGKLTIVGVARGRKKAMRRLAEFYEKVHRESPGQPVFVGNADCPKDAARLHDLVSEVNPDASFLDGSIGPTIGCHVGPDMLSCCFWGVDRREQMSVADRIASRVKGK